MDISLTPQELRALLVPPLMRVHTALDLDALAGAGTLGGDRDELSVQRQLVTTLADLAQAQEELGRVRTMTEDKAEELATLIAKIAELQRTPAAEANAVIERAGRQVLELATHFFSAAGDSWYEGCRAGFAGLVSTLGVEVESESLEESLRTREADIMAEPPPAPALELVPLSGSITLAPDDGREDLGDFAPGAPDDPAVEELVAPALEPLEAPLVIDPKCTHPIELRARRRTGAECVGCGTRFVGELAALDAAAGAAERERRGLVEPVVDEDTF